MSDRSTQWKTEEVDEARGQGVVKLERQDHTDNPDRVQGAITRTSGLSSLLLSPPKWLDIGKVFRDSLNVSDLDDPTLT